LKPASGQGVALTLASGVNVDLMESLTIGDVAQRVGVTPEAIRYYERLGVLEEAPRNTAGYRQYSARVVDELRLLKAAQALGFSLEAIARILTLTRQEPIRCRPMCEIVEDQIAQLDAHVRELVSARDRLAAAVAACGHNDVCVVAKQLTLNSTSS
jgi:DNA-binding transcriptional MerR regulator